MGTIESVDKDTLGRFMYEAPKEGNGFQKNSR